MAGRGRPRKTQEQHDLDGTFRADRHGTRSVAGGEPQQIIPLDGHAEQMWNLIVPQLVALGVAKAIDSFALCTLCRLAAQLNAIFEEDETDEYKRSGAAAAVLKQVNVYLEKFGMTPIDRQKGHFGDDKQDNPFALFLMGIHGGTNDGDSKATDQQGAGRSVHRRSAKRKDRRRKAS